MGDPSLPTVGWEGASVAMRFVGTALSVTMDGGGRDEQFRVVLDG
ncbi:MAG: electron transporter RnfD, partial [Victivallales bacterium]|nr:electron transporter RnfD [Victivallales bacterium]